MKEKKIYKKNPDMVSRTIDGEMILVPIFKTSEDINCIYTLNAAAAVVWDMIDGKNTCADIKKKILETFDITDKEADTKLQEVFKDFKEIKAIL